MKRFIFAALGLFLIEPALAQWQVPLNQIPVGRGPGVSGFNTVLGSSGAGTKCLTDTVPPSFVLCAAGSNTIVIDTTPIIGGTLNGLIYDHASKVGNLATANNGVLQTDGSGVPSISSTLPSGLTIPAPVITGSFTATGLVAVAGEITGGAGLTFTTSSAFGGSNSRYYYNSSTGSTIQAKIGSTSDFSLSTPTGNIIIDVPTGTSNLRFNKDGGGSTFVGPVTIPGVSAGGIVYSTASALSVLAGTATAGQCLLSGSSAAPSWGACAGGAAVSAVSNSDGTLTISPTTGAVVASLALGHFNTWTNKVGITTAVGTLNFDFETTGAVGGTASQTATQGKIFGGSSGTPLTTPVPMVSISRYEAFSGTDTQGAQNPALLIELFSNNTSNEPTINAQGTGLKVEATQIATGRGDIVAGFFYATQSGLVGTATGHASYGIFAQANVTINNNNAFGGEIVVSNNTGTDYSYNGTYPFAAALHVGATGSNRANIGVWFQGSKTFDVGVVFDSTSITTASIQDDSSAVTSIKIKGSHTTGLDTSSGTFSGNQINATGFTVSSSGATTSRYIGGGSSPTVGTCTGLGTGGSPGCAMGANSTDNAGQFILTTGTTSPGSNGSATLTFSGAIGPHSSVCTFTPSSGSAAWSNPSTTAGAISTTAFVLDWENGNGATALTASKTYVVNYICLGY